MIAVKKFLDNIEKYIIYVVLTVLVTLMFGQVVARYVFGLATADPPAVGLRHLCMHELRMQEK